MEKSIQNHGILIAKLENNGLLSFGSVTQSYLLEHLGLLVSVEQLG